MKKIGISLALVGSVLLAISENAAARTDEDESTDTEKLQLTPEEAAVINDLVSRGYLQLDTTTRQFVLKAPVLKILESYNLVDDAGVKTDPVKTTGTRC